MGWFSRYRFAGHGVMFLIQRLSLLLLLALPAFLPNTAFAGTFTPPLIYKTSSNLQSITTSSVQATCDAARPLQALIDYPSGTPTYGDQTSCALDATILTSGTNVRYKRIYAAWLKTPCSISCQGSAAQIGTQQQVCPAGTTLSGTMPNVLCTDTCVSPQVYNQTTNTCGAPPPPPCETGCTGACGSNYTLNVLNLPNTTCISGCNYNVGDGIQGTSGPWLFIVGRNLGTTCTPPAPAPATAPPSCPECDCIKAGKSYGTVNGTVVCTTLGSTGSAPAVVKSTSSSSSSGTSTDASGTPSTSGSETQQDTIRVYNGDGTVSTSTEAATTNSDGSTTTSTGTKTQSTDDFCAENPTSAACKQQSQCEENPEIPACKHFCEEYPTSVTCANFESFWDEAAGLPEDGGIINTVKEMTFDLVEITGSNSCPPPVVLSFGGHSVSVSYNWLCEYAESFRPVVIAFAYLAAITIVFGAFRKGDF